MAQLPIYNPHEGTARRCGLAINLATSACTLWERPTRNPDATSAISRSTTPALAVDDGSVADPDQQP